MAYTVPPQAPAASQVPAHAAGHAPGPAAAYGPAAAAGPAPASSTEQTLALRLRTKPFRDKVFAAINHAFPQGDRPVSMLVNMPGYLIQLLALRNTMIEWASKTEQEAEALILQAMRPCLRRAVDAECEQARIEVDAALDSGRLQFVLVPWDRVS